jgi:hypothetical protein
VNTGQRLAFQPAATGGGPGSGGAPADATYLVGSADGDLTNEILLADANGYGLLAARPAASTEGFLYYATDNETLYRDNGSTWDALDFPGTADHGALSGLSDDDHPQYVKDTGDTLTGGLLVTGTAATEAFRTLVTGETNNRFRVLADGQTRIIGRDAAIPTYTGVNRPMVYIEALGGQSSTGVIIRGSSDTTTGNQIFRAEDYLGAPIAWLAYAGGWRITDAMAAVNGVFTVTEQAGFFFRNTNGSGAILSNLDTLSLCFGVSSRVWSGDLVGSGKTLGLNISRSSWSFTGSINSTTTVTVLSGLPDARAIPIGSVLQGITGIPNGTTVTATTVNTITLSAAATATTASLTIRIYEPDTLAIRAWNGVEIHGRLSGSDSAAGKILFDGGLILSGDNDTDGWKISTNDKNLLPPASGVGGEIGTTSNRLRRLWVDYIRVQELLAPRSGTTTVDLGETANPFRTLYVGDIQGTVNDGWVSAPTAWTRVSDTQFTISSATDFTSRYQKGTRLKWTDSGGTKYGVVASSSFASSTTTVNLIPTSDFVMASSPTAAGTRWYSHQASPQGFPGWFNYSPTLTGWSSNPTTTCYRWNAIGTMMTIECRQGVATTSNTTTIRIGTPVPCSSVANGQWGTVWYLATDNSLAVAGPGRAIINVGTGPSANGDGFNVDKDLLGGGWTASGTKRVSFVATYEF